MKKENRIKNVFWRKQFLILILFSLAPSVALPMSPIQKNECIAPILFTDQISQDYENFFLQGWRVSFLKDERFIWISGAIDSIHLEKEGLNQFDQLRDHLENFGISFSDLKLVQNTSCTTFQLKQELEVH